MDLRTQSEKDGTITLLAVFEAGPPAMQARNAFLGGFRGTCERERATVAQICSMSPDLVGAYGQMALDAMNDPKPVGKQKVDLAARLASSVFDSICLPPNFNIETGEYETTEAAHG